jgi:hypothetical protein
MEQELEFMNEAHALGYKAFAVKQMETPRGVSAVWEVLLDGKVFMSCYDAGDGSCLTYRRNADVPIKEFQLLCEKHFDFEAIENGLIILSCEGALS